MKLNWTIPESSFLVLNPPLSQALTENLRGKWRIVSKPEGGLVPSEEWLQLSGWQLRSNALEGPAGAPALQSLHRFRG